MRVKGLTITNAETNFIHARRRVQEKLGKNKTGKAPPPPTPAFRRGGPPPRDVPVSRKSINISFVDRGSAQPRS